MRRLRLLFFNLGVIFFISMTSAAQALSDISTPEKPTMTGGKILPPGTRWQWQLSGPIDTTLAVDMFDLDLFETPKSIIDALHDKKVIVICYFSAGSWESYRSDASIFPANIRGLTMDGWPDEKWLDIRDTGSLRKIMASRLDLAVNKGCDGVEPDNVDGYSNDTGFPLTANDQIRYNRWLSNEAHARNLSIGLKNDLEQIVDLVSYFDWALNEQCFEYDECELLTPFIKAGKAVFGVEYNIKTSNFCSKANRMNFDWLLKNLNLDAKRVSCR